MNFSFLVLALPLLVMGCSKDGSETNNQIDERSRVAQTVAATDAVNADGHRLVVEIKQGLIELSSLEDPNINEIFVYLNRFQKKGSASYDELMMVKQMIQAHKQMLAVKGDTGHQSEIAREISNSLLAGAGEITEGDIERELLVLKSKGDPDIILVYRLIDNLIADGSLSSRDKIEVMQMINNHKQVIF